MTYNSTLPKVFVYLLTTIETLYQTSVLLEVQNRKNAHLATSDCLVITCYLWGVLHFSETLKAKHQLAQSLFRNFLEYSRFVRRCNALLPSIQVIRQALVFKEVEGIKYIYISENHNKAIFFASIIQEEINKNKKSTNIGEVSINPISEKIELDIRQKTPIKEISLSYVYPNGKKEVDERNVAIKQIKADREERTYKTSSKQGISEENVKNLAEEEGKKGYLSDILYKGRSVVKWIQLEIRKDFK